MHPEQYAPPPGPPPGWQGQHQPHSSSYLPPPPANQYQQSSHSPQGHNYNAPPPQQYYPPPSHPYPSQQHHGQAQYQPPPLQQQQHHHYPPQRPVSNSGYNNGYNHQGAPHHQSGPPRRGGPFPAGFTQLPPKFWLRVRYGSGLESSMELTGEPKGDAIYSAKMGASGRMKFKPGKYKHAADTVIGEANNKNLLSTTPVITYQGREYELKKSHVGLSGQEFSFQVPGAGERMEEWKWVAADKSLTAKLTSHTGWKLVRKGAEDGPGVVIFKNDSSLGLTSEGLGSVEFVGQGLTGELGDVLPNVAVMSLTKIKAAEVEKKLLKAFT